MSKKSNKVKFGLKNCHYAKATFDEDGGVTYDTPVRIPGAVSLSLDANGEIEPFYADNIAYYVVNNNSGYEGDLEIALIPESFLTDIMHEELDGNGVLAENANAELEHFASCLSLMATSGISVMSCTTVSHPVRQWRATPTRTARRSRPIS